MLNTLRRAKNSFLRRFVLRQTDDRIRQLSTTLEDLRKKHNTLQAEISKLKNYPVSNAQAQSSTVQDIQKLQKTVAQLQRDNHKFHNRINAISDILFALYARSKQEEQTDFNPQETAWATKHGFRYIVHHMEEDWRTTRVPLWSKVLPLVNDISSVCEFGGNIGANLKAIGSLRNDIELYTVEINAFACEILAAEGIAAKCESVSSVEFDQRFDLVFSRGVLIHLAPDEVSKVLHRMASHARTYVMIMETYSEEYECLTGYSENVGELVGNVSVGYQFWADYSNMFQEIYPDWTVVASGVQDKVGKVPQKGDLYWVLFKRPSILP